MRLTQCMPVVGGARSSYTPIRVAAVAGWFPLRVRDEVEVARVGPGDLDAGNAEMASAAQPSCRPCPLPSLQPLLPLSATTLFQHPYKSNLTIHSLHFHNSHYPQFLPLSSQSKSFSFSRHFIT